MHFENVRHMDPMAMAAATAEGETTARGLLDYVLVRADAVNPELNAVASRGGLSTRCRGPRGGRTPSGGPVRRRAVSREGPVSGAGRRGLHPGLSRTVGRRPRRGRDRTRGRGQRWGEPIRILASHSGLFGFKPGWGRTPVGPVFSEGMHGAAVHRVISRSVRDSAAMLDAARGSEPVAPAPPAPPFSEAAAPGSLRIGYATRSPLGTAVDPEHRAAVAETGACWKHWATGSRRRNR